MFDSGKYNSVKLEVLWIQEKQCGGSALACYGTWGQRLIFRNFGSIARFFWKISLTEVDLKSIVLYKLLSIVNKTINWHNF